ncbi:MAG: sporulation protein YqfD [Lachnospiraceae bacterium]|nr:sporulation protein YqfD [Lachnospiraceae bacterium]
MNSYFKNGSFLRLKLEGQGLERFITLCGNRHIPLWNIRADGKYCYANIHYRDWEQGKELLKKNRDTGSHCEKTWTALFIARIEGQSSVRHCRACGGGVAFVQHAADLAYRI